MQGLKAGVHVHSQQTFSRAGTDAISAASGCQALAFSPDGETLAVAEGPPSCRLALWDWKQVRLLR